jgi:hypothetical protein
MPYHIEKKGSEWCVIKDDDGESMGCHDTKAEAKAQLAALYASEDTKMIAIDDRVFYTQAHVVVRATDSALLATAKKKAPDPAIFDEHPPFMWQSEISSDRLDAYFTVMDPETTLPNYARDAQSGVAVLVSHNTWEMPIGYSLTGTLEEDGKITRVLSDAYALTDEATAATINRLRAGIVRDVSVGFSARGAQCLCSICGRDMWRDWKCWHIPGYRYKRTDNKDDAVTDPNGELATGLIVNAHLAEYSLVYDGATPGAAVLQAQRCAEAGRMRPEEIRVIEQRYKLALPNRRIQHNGYAKELSMAKELETDHDALDTGAPDLRAMQQIVERSGAPKGSTILQGLEWMASEITRLSPLARDGEQYRADLVDAGIIEAVRAFGAEAGEKKRALLQALALDDIKELTASWRDIGDAKLKGGRLTTDDSGADSAKPFEWKKVKIGGTAKA